MTRASILKTFAIFAAAILISGVALAPARAKAPHMSISLEFEPSSAQPTPAPVAAPAPAPAPTAPLAEPTPAPQPAAQPILSGDDFDLPVHDTETIRKTYTMAAGSAHKSLIVDNIFGSIDVTAIDGDQVQLVVNKTLRAESQSKLELARKEVTLDVTDQPDLLKLYVNGPFRCDCNGGCNGYHGDRDEAYRVNMDFQLQVPRNIDVELRTVNSGHIDVKGVTGEFVVRNVNGTVDMTDIAGSGTARSVNGHVKVSFRESPKQNSGFGSVNGAIELSFPHTLAADFRFKTFNGGVYTDFPVTALPMRAAEEQHEGSKVVIRSDRYSGGRIGAGGPEIRVDTLNGDIRILSK
jgi:hypothetical protein